MPAFIHMSQLRSLTFMGWNLILFGKLAWICGMASQAQSEMDFEKWVRPLLVDRCGVCHSEERTEAGFRTDSQLGFSSNSRAALDRLPRFMLSHQNAGDPHELPPQHYDKFTDWISNGAIWPDSKIPDKSGADALWALQPMVRVTPPEVKDADWNAHPIDQFIYDRLESAGLSPSPMAEPRTLIRRLYQDLVGLQPEYEVVRDLQHKWDDTVLAQVIDQLLASPGYGERWGRHWLDVARYSDAKGYVDSGEVLYPFAYAYRDYVVNAMNRDVPYDQFIRDQIAADHFQSPPRPQALAALGFLTIGHRFNFFWDEVMDDRIDVISRGFLGLTASCARCHDHKFDPISTKNYYSLFGIMRNSIEPTPDQFPAVTTDASHEISPARKEAIAKAADEYHALRQNLHQKMSHEMRRWAGDYLQYLVQVDSNHRTRPQPDQRTERGLIRVKSAYAQGGVIRWQQFLENISEDHAIFGLWARLWKLPKSAIAGQSGHVIHLWAKAPGTSQVLLHQSRTFENGLKSMEDVAQIYGSVFESVCAEWEDLRQADPQASQLPNPDRELIRAFLYGPECPGTLSIDDSEDLYTLNESVDVRDAFGKIEKVILEEWKDMPVRAMVLEDRPESDYIHQVIYRRGNRLTPGEVVPREIPPIISGTRSIPISHGSGRKELAQAIASPQNPLTARVLVNRVWAWHFGKGLVLTPSDFGSRSQPPSHPQLLDFLAQWLIDHDWSIKSLHRLILTSRTWRQMSDIRPVPNQVDPDNRLLWKMNKQRLDFESMRDSILQSANLLTPSMGGLPVQASPDDPTHTRRTIYTFIDREKLAEVFRVFDFPTPDISASNRSSTSVPQQTLFLINSPFLIHAAQSIAHGIIHPEESQVSPEHIGRLFEKTLLRPPTTQELQQSQEYIQLRKTTSPADSHASSVAILPELAQSLLISNEFQFID